MFLLNTDTHLFSSTNLHFFPDATIYVGGLDDKVSEGLLWELFVQAGPVVNVHMPKDRVTQQHQGYGFVEFMGEEDADYAIKIMNMIKVSDMLKIPTWSLVDVRSLGGYKRILRKAHWSVLITG